MKNMEKLSIFDFYVKIISMHEFTVFLVHNLLFLFYFISYIGAGNEQSEKSQD